MVPPIITLEEHWLSEVCLSTTKDPYIEMFKQNTTLFNRLAEAGPVRIQSMDAGKVTLQVVNHGPRDMTPEECRAANNELAAIVEKYKKRFVAFAMVPMHYPAEAAKELARCIKELGFCGSLIANRDNETYFDGPEYDVFWEAAQALDTPIYMHPTWPTDNILKSMYQGNYSPAVAVQLASSGFGWHADVATHVLKLYCAGTFDKFPRLKLIIGHMGETLPFMLQRIDSFSPMWRPGARTFRQVYDDNIWITTSGNWSLDPMYCILRNTKIEKIMYSVDYPFASNEAGLEWVEELEKSGLVTAEELDRICYKNAEALMGIKIPK
ncbi:Decarboxylase orsB [Hyphodiscus hymeniophilus]|uniref:Decarboxylase orsB n=1 Tax=Hyphodiscus hymeniophilus TaxID=353542 RepID=A0A9P6SK43_9HELO|nr:Decarboxylase orsB [Hyphodiscus hymeniophilus]